MKKCDSQHLSGIVKDPVTATILEYFEIQPIWSMMCKLTSKLRNNSLRELLVWLFTKSKNHAKTSVKKSIWANEIYRWKCMRFMYPNLSMYYKCITGPQIYSWWKYIDRHPNQNIYVRALMAILLGGQPKLLQCNFRCNSCKLCSSGSLEDTAHVLFVCPALQDARGSAWAELMTNTDYARCNGGKHDKCQ